MTFAITIPMPRNQTPFCRGIGGAGSDTCLPPLGGAGRMDTYMEPRRLCLFLLYENEDVLDYYDVEPVILKERYDLYKARLMIKKHTHDFSCLFFEDGKNAMVSAT